MKTILVPTDFSPPARSACRYALGMAKMIGADIILCHAVKVVKEPPITFQASLPIENVAALKQEALDQLEFIAADLREDIETTAGCYIPVIGTAIEAGSLTDMIELQQTKANISLIVMGTYGSPALSRLFLGCSSQELIDKSSCPVLLVPFAIFSDEIKKIAFASDLSGQDIPLICSLIDLVRSYNADVLIIHIDEEDKVSKDHEQKSDLFLNDIKNKTGYLKVVCRHITNSSVSDGLDWLCRYGSIDLLAMVHYRHNLIERVFKKSHTGELAKHIDIPLLVFPAVAK